jgi:hypothetical protein
MRKKTDENNSEDYIVTIRSEQSKQGLREHVEYEYPGCPRKVPKNDSELPLCALGTNSSIYVCKKCVQTNSEIPKK